MGEGKHHTQLRAGEEGEGLVNYNLPNLTSVPGKVMEQILPAVTAKHLKDEKGTASRDLQRADRT